MSNEATKTGILVGDPIKASIVIKGVAFEGVYQDKNEPGYVMGACDILGASFHVLFVRAWTDSEGYQSAWDDPHGHFEDIQALNEGFLETVEIPGFDGEWAMVVYPFAK